MRPSAPSSAGSDQARRRERPGRGQTRDRRTPARAESRAARWRRSARPAAGAGLRRADPGEPQRAGRAAKPGPQRHDRRGRSARERSAGARRQRTSAAITGVASDSIDAPTSKKVTSTPRLDELGLSPHLTASIRPRGVRLRTRSMPWYSAICRVIANESRHKVVSANGRLRAECGAAVDPKGPFPGAVARRRRRGEHANARSTTSALRGSGECCHRRRRGGG